MALMTWSTIIALMSEPTQVLVFQKAARTAQEGHVMPACERQNGIRQAPTGMQPHQHHLALCVCHRAPCVFHCLSAVCRHEERRRGKKFGYVLFPESAPRADRGPEARGRLLGISERRRVDFHDVDLDGRQQARQVDRQVSTTAPDVHHHPTLAIFLRLLLLFWSARGGLSTSVCRGWSVRIGPCRGRSTAATA